MVVFALDLKQNMGGKYVLADAALQIVWAELQTIRTCMGPQVPAICSAGMVTHFHREAPSWLFLKESALGLETGPTSPAPRNFLCCSAWVNNG